MRCKHGEFSVEEGAKERSDIRHYTDVSVLSRGFVSLSVGRGNHFDANLSHSAARAKSLWEIPLASCVVMLRVTRL